MNFIKTGIDGLYVVELIKIGDKRGFFARAWCETEFADKNLTSRMVQANTSYSKNKGTLRGLHYQVIPHEEAKLMRCIKGAIFDVAVDIRPGSATFGAWVGVELSGDNKQQLWVPEGFAHGFVALEDDTDVLYKATDYYDPDDEFCLRWDDEAIGVEWPVGDLTPRVSNRDRLGKTLGELPLFD